MRRMDLDVYNSVVLGTKLLINSSLNPLQNYDFLYIPTQIGAIFSAITL